jgi:hypothetical protein
MGLVTPHVAAASPIYVFKESDGSIRFSSRPPARGVEAKVFTAKQASFSRYRGIGLSVGSPIKGYRTIGMRPRAASKTYSPIIEAVSRLHAVDPNLVKAVIHAESAFNPYAISPKGAQGLMQLMPDTARELGVARPFSPTENIKGGVKFLARLLRQYNGNNSLALAAYNAGPEAVRRHGGIPPYSETRQYVSRVLYLKSRYKALS